MLLKWLPDALQSRTMYPAPIKTEVVTLKNRQISTKGIWKTMSPRPREQVVLYTGISC